MVEALDYLNVDITVQQIVDFMERPTPLPGSMRETAVMRSIATLVQIIKCAHTAVELQPGQPPTFGGSALLENIDEPARLRIKSVTQSVMASFVVMDGERYQFTPAVKVLLTTPKRLWSEKLQMSERLFRKATDE